MAKLTLTPLGLLVLPFVFVASLNAQTTTGPVGVVKITIAAAPVNGTKLTAISATLRGAIEYQGTATSVGTFSSSSQTLNTGVTTWNASKWTSDPHLCYIENAAGAEEAYLISSMDESTGVLTLATIFDITTRYTSTPTFRIVKAQTVGSLFGTAPASVPFKQDVSSSNADNIFIWNGTAWDAFWHDGTTWTSTTIFGSANDSIVFPDEGMFVLRRDVTDIVITLKGAVPTKKQISTVAGAGLTFLSTRYPVDTTVADLGLTSITGWVTSIDSSSADRFFVWNGSSWGTYWHDGTTWVSTTVFGNANDEVIPGDSAIFVRRISAGTETNSANTHTLPYMP